MRRNKPTFSISVVKYLINTSLIRYMHNTQSDKSHITLNLRRHLIPMYNVSGANGKMCGSATGIRNFL